jgi:hypothetical protein
VTEFLNKVISWLRAGYPEGVPQTDYLPLFALLRRQLTMDEVRVIAAEMIQRPGGVDDIDIGTEILAVLDDLPAPVDVERVREHLVAKGWPMEEWTNGRSLQSRPSDGTSESPS